VGPRRVTAAIPAKPGRPARTDYEYERNGTANIFMLFAPLEGWRHVKVTDRHAAVDYARILKDLSDRWFPDAAKIAPVQDNLSTQTRLTSRGLSTRGSSPSRGTVRVALHREARQLAEHGRNPTQRVVITVSAPAYPQQRRLIGEVSAWEAAQNKHHAKADWFNTADAQVKLKRLYPSL
jgi:hypothetical protein